MFIVNHAGNKSVDEYLLSTAFDVSTATFESEISIVNKLVNNEKEQIQLHLIMMVPECLLLV